MYSRRGKGVSKREQAFNWRFVSFPWLSFRSALKFWNPNQNAYASLRISFSPIWSWRGDYSLRQYLGRSGTKHCQIIQISPCTLLATACRYFFCFGPTHWCHTSTPMLVEFHWKNASLSFSVFSLLSGLKTYHSNSPGACLLINYSVALHSFMTIWQHKSSDITHILVAARGVFQSAL